MSFRTPMRNLVKLVTVDVVFTFINDTGLYEILKQVQDDMVRVFLKGMPSAQIQQPAGFTNSSIKDTLF